MADLLVRGVPEQLHRRLKEAAERNHRSLNGELLARLEASILPDTVDVDVLAARIEARRRRLDGLELDEGLLRELKESGRP